VDVLEVRALKQEGMGPSAIAKMLGIGRASVYWALGQQTSFGPTGILEGPLRARGEPIIRTGAEQCLCAGEGSIEPRRKTHQQNMRKRGRQSFDRPRGLNGRLKAL
jgi:hypothetical protein